MRRSLLALWLSLVGAIVTIGLLAYFWAQQRADSAQQRVAEVLQAQLEPYRDAVQRVLDDYAITLQRQLSDTDLQDLPSCVELTRSPLAAAVVVVDAEQQLHFPRDASLSSERQSLLEEALQLLREQADPRPQPQAAAFPPPIADPTSLDAGGELSARTYPASQRAGGDLPVAQASPPAVPQSNLARPSPSTPASSSGPAASNRSLTERQTRPADATQPEVQPQAAVAGQAADGERQAKLATQPFGWMTWYHRRGMVLAFWWRASNDWQCLVVLPRARWMADVVAALPASSPNPEYGLFDKIKLDAPPAGSLKQLIDFEGNLIYQWGDSAAADWESLSAASADAAVPLADPLEGWRLRNFASPPLRESLAGDDILLPLLLGVLGISLALVLGGVLVTVNLNRQLRLATQRVSFVNQVSHELRTPLTNICMYADLLAQTLPEEPAEGEAWTAKVREDAAIIQSESQRLNRLIGNVLLFARPTTKQSQLRITSCVIDSVVRDILATFEPRLAQLGFQLHCDLAVDTSRQADPDVLEQILVNLIGNAEKYAAAGGQLTITTRAEGEMVSICVADAGPGIPKRHAERIFAPFVRLSDRLQDPAGTGIGLTIARQLARLHGGDCQLLDTSSGATFCCTLLAKRTPSNSATAASDFGSP